MYYPRNYINNDETKVIIFSLCLFKYVYKKVGLGCAVYFCVV